MRPTAIRCVTAAFALAFALCATPVRAGVDLGAAVKGNASADDWIAKTVKDNRSDWRSFEEIPDEIFNIFYGAPFSEFLNEMIKSGKFPAGVNRDCAAAAFDASYKAVNEWENISGSPIGGFIQFGKRWYGRVQTAFGAWGLAKAEGKVLDKLKDAAADAIKDEAKEIGKEGAKDAVKTGDPAIQQKIEDRVTDLYNQIRDYFKKGPVVFWDQKTVGPCSLAMLWLWDGSKLDLYIYGNCGCSLVKVGARSVKVRTFAIHIEAKTYLDRSDPAKPRFAASPYDGMRVVEFKAECDCDGKTAKAVPPPAQTTPPPPPYRPIEETRTTCDPCKAQLAKVIDIQKQIAANDSEIRDKAGERAAAEAEIRLAKDTGKPEPQGAIDRLRDLGRDNTRLVNKKIQLTAAWRAAMKDLEECEKKCKTATATPGQPVHAGARSRITTEKKRPRKPEQPRRETISTEPPPGVSIDIGIGGQPGREREHRRERRRGDDRGRTEERGRPVERGGGGFDLPGATFGR